MYEKREMKYLFKVCFPEETNEYVNYFFDNIYRRKNAFYKKIAGKIVSGFHIVEKTMCIAGYDFFVPFITGAATLPEHRSKGYMDKLLSDALITLREKKADCLALGTDDKHEFYQKYGFKTYSYFKEKKITVKEKRPYKLMEVKSTSAEAAGVLESVYEKFTAGKNGYVLRDREYFFDWQDEVFADKGKLFFIKEGREFTGYVYDDRGDLKEFVLLDEKLADSLGQFEGADVKFFSGSGSPHNMIRILNPARVLSNIDYAAGISESVTVKIKDDKIKENNIILRLDVEDGAGYVSLAEKAEFTVDIATLAALVMGLETELPEKLKKLFKKQDNIVLDRY